MRSWSLINVLCTESGVATRTDPTTPPPSLSLSLSLSLRLNVSSSISLVLSLSLRLAEAIQVDAGMAACTTARMAGGPAAFSDLVRCECMLALWCPL